MGQCQGLWLHRRTRFEVWSASLGKKTIAPSLSKLSQILCVVTRFTSLLRASMPRPLPIGFYPMQSDTILECFRFCAEQVLFGRPRETRKQVKRILESAADADVIGNNFSDVAEDDGHSFSKPREFVKKGFLAILIKTFGKMIGN